MNFDAYILTLILLIPLAGAILLALLPDKGKLMPGVALAVTLLTFLATLHLPSHYSYQALPGTFQFEQNISWIASPAIRYHLGVDGLSIWLVVLAGLLAPLGVLASWNAVGTRRKTFYVLFLLQQVAMLGVFLSLDLFLYYAFWELSLVPMTLLIATFGRTANRRRAAIKYFLYAFIPSAILLVGMLWVYTRTGTFDLPTIASKHLLTGHPAAMWLASLAFLVAFAVKIPGLPASWLAGRRHLRGPHRRRHGPRRKARPLLHPPLLLRPLPCRIPPHRPPHACARSHRHRLRLAHRHHAGRPQATRRLRHSRRAFVHHPRHLHLHHLRP